MVQDPQYTLEDSNGNALGYIFIDDYDNLILERAVSGTQVLIGTNGIPHSDLASVGAEDHHNQVDDESGTFSAASSSGNVTTTVSFGQAYATGVGSVGMKTASPVGGGDAAVVGYTTNADGDIDGMTIRYENTTANSHTVEWRFAGRPA